MSDQPVTRAELLEALTSTKQDILEALGQTLGEHKREILEKTQEFVRDAQTEILRAFQPFEERRASVCG